MLEAIIQVFAFNFGQTKRVGLGKHYCRLTMMYKVKFQREIKL